MTSPSTETIVAIATPPGSGAIGIVRLSGPCALSIARQMVSSDLPPRHAVFTSFLDNQEAVLDQGLALYFPAPRSYTGEDMVELHAHGSPAVLRELVRNAIRLGARQARPGEFTERAFMNDKLDLLQAEAVADLIESRSLLAARNASLSLQGRFSSDVDDVLSAIIDLRAWVESALDFPEEEIDFLADGHVAIRLDECAKKIRGLLERSQQGKQLREGKRIVIAGRPNVGKSSLMNCLSGYDTAIVSEISGTTRDTIEQVMDFSGVTALVTDTAGLRDAHDPVESEGVKRARQALANSDIIIHVCEAGDESPGDEIATLPEGAMLLRVYNKIDVIDQAPRMSCDKDIIEIWLSAKTAAGVDLLQAEIARQLAGTDNNEHLLLARQRHIEAMENALACLLQGRQQLQGHGAGELLAEDLLKAQQSLAGLKGEFLADDLLGEIFSRFCIGK